MSRVKKKYLSWIEERMQSLNVTQEQLAKFLKVHRSTVSRLFSSGVPKLDPARMQRLCVALRVSSIDELVRVCQPKESETLHDLIEEWNEIQKK